ncbi:hypothetical protein L2E82_14556 [Cichorium intybus]|uniref:Uncharacterized protein n=1 Tax=Cichorium intybus TaxID=13427 RepID=A0ACB9F0R7_CICIN|nr:hypothetical protein L2E82_14556 [Cichorium intybus]
MTCNSTWPTKRNHERTLVSQEVSIVDTSHLDMMAMDEMEYVEFIEENWKWFLELLAEDLHLESGLSVSLMSDQHKGLLEAVKEVLASVAMWTDVV